MNLRLNRKKLTSFLFFLLLLPVAGIAQTLAPGAPGKDAQWATAGKQGVGTSVTLESKVWFTLAQGVMTEVYYPDVTVANVHKLEFIVVDPKTKKVETEQSDAIHSIAPGKNSLIYSQASNAKSGEWIIFKHYVTDPQSNTVMMSVDFKTKNKDNVLYIYYDPSIGNSGMHDTAWNQGEALLSQDGAISSALVVQGGLTEISNGFYETNDGIAQLRKDGKITETFSRAENGNVVQIAKVKDAGKYAFNVALSFDKSPDAALKTAGEALDKGIETTLLKFEKGWTDYVKTLRRVEPKYQAQFNMAAMQLKALEDKTVRGANIASLTVPWGGDKNANENTVGGYHLVWSRDLYQVATAFIALGDKAAAERALDFLFKIQQKPDGSFPQNSFLDGKPFWGSLQLDEVAFPLILAYQLGKNDKTTYESHVKRAADFIVKNGPKTPQERWEEEGGYSPSTIAAEIAGLVCAAEIARKNGDDASANLYLKTADEWQANVEKWTVTTNGKYSKEPYYVRITGNGKPDAGEKIELNNGAGFFDEREIVDAGFLELVRLGIKSPDDKIIQNSLKVIDEVIRVKTPNGDAFYRYNHDGYGEMDDGRRWNWDGKYTGKGRLWALLSGERGQYELALNRELTRLSLYQSGRRVSAKTGKAIENPKSEISNPKSRLDAMLNFANDGLMIPEQIWDSPNVPKNADQQFVPELKFGEGTGSATPLAWSMAQFIRLAVNLQEGRNLDTPDIVYDRYVLGKKVESTNLAASISDKDGVQNDLPLLNKTSLNLVNQQSPQIIECASQSPLTVCNKEIQKNFCIIHKEKFKILEIAGDFTNWKPRRIGTGDDKKREIACIPFKKTARIEYKLIVDGKWIIDPLNPNKIDNGVGGENSFFTMPDYKPTVWDNSDGQTKYAVSTEKINSKIYGAREIRVYVPEGFSAQDLPVLYLQDGTDYQKRADAVFIQRNLVKANKLKPFIMVFIDYKDRTKEYRASDDYAKYVAEEIVPVIDAKFKTIKSPDGRAIMGASLGGITSVHTALKYPEIFGRIAGQSSSWWIDDERVVKELETLDASKTKLKFYLDDGTLEGVEDSRKAVEILKAKGYDVTYTEGEAGHNWTAWRDRLADAFIALWQ